MQAILYFSTIIQYLFYVSAKALNYNNIYSSWPLLIHVTSELSASFCPLQDKNDNKLFSLCKRTKKKKVCSMHYGSLASYKIDD